jgi:uncharacterized membrane protein YkvA (DUF1232 family)
MIYLLKRALDEEITAAGLADALRRHVDDVATEDVEQLAAVLEQFLRAVPDALAWTLALSKDPSCGRAVAFATGPILAYVFDEEDLLPESTFGALGLLDDAYLVHAFAARLAQTYPFAEPAVAYSPPDDRGFEAIASLLPHGVADALRRTCESTILVAQALFPATAAAAVDGQDTPELRVKEAVRATATS